MVLPEVQQQTRTIRAAARNVADERERRRAVKKN